MFLKSLFSVGGLGFELRYIANTFSGSLLRARNHGNDFRGLSSIGILS